MITAAIVTLMLQAAAAPPPRAAAPQPKAAAPGARSRTPATPATAAPAAGAPYPLLVCGYEKPANAAAYDFICRTQAEIDANVKKGATFSVAQPFEQPKS